MILWCIQVMEVIDKHSMYHSSGSNNMVQLIYGWNITFIIVQYINIIIHFTTMNYDQENRMLMNQHFKCIIPCLEKTYYLNILYFKVSKTERLFYTKTTLSRVVIFPYSNFFSSSWEQFFFLAKFG